VLEKIHWVDKKGYLVSLVKAALLDKIKSMMQRASTLENNCFNVVLLKYLWRTTAVYTVLGHSKSI